MNQQNKYPFLCLLTIVFISCILKKEIPNLRTPFLGNYDCKLDSTIERITFINDSEYNQTFYIKKKKLFTNKGCYTLDYTNKSQGYSLNLYNYIVFNPNAVFHAYQFRDTIHTAFFYDAFEDSAAIITRAFEKKQYNFNYVKK